MKDNNEKKVKKKVNYLTKKVNKDSTVKENVTVKKKISRRKKINNNVDDNIVVNESLNNSKNNYCSKLIYMIIGFVVCLLLLFGLSGGKNYFRLFYELRDFIEVYDLITSDFYGDLDKGKMVNAAIDAMLVDVEDYYTTYIDKDSTNNFLEDVNGTYHGIGCSVSTNVDGDIYIVEVFEDSPSSEAGLKEGDIILKVNGEDYSNKTSVDMSEYIKNSDDEEVILNVKRDDNVFDITIKRKEVEIPVVNGQIFENNNKNIGFISIDVFSSVSYAQIKNKLKKLEENGIDGLIIDVRGNNGGYLSAVTNISSLFLEKGKVIYQLKDDKGTEKIKDSTKESRSYPIAVLVNAGSASASEIFAATIKESYGGFVVGTNTYGKGTVQKTKVLNDGSMVKYTIQNWLTPNGNFVDEIGLEPTNVVEYKSLNGYDSQFLEALKLVSQDN